MAGEARRLRAAHLGIQLLLVVGRALGLSRGENLAEDLAGGGAKGLGGALVGGNQFQRVQFDDQNGVGSQIKDGLGLGAQAEVFQVAPLGLLAL